jgi:3-oxoadipate enol-lactonase
VRDIDLYYELAGDGPPLVLVPGLGVDSRLFHPIIGKLTRYRTLTFDPRGAGRSAKPDIPYTIAMLAEDTAALMCAVGMPRAHVLGLSMGGRIALELALEHRYLVSGLVLVSTSARTLPYRAPSWRWLLMDVLPRLPLLDRLDPQPMYAHDRQRQASRDYDASGRLGRIDVPTLIVHGRCDHVVSLPLAVELQEQIAGSRLVTVPGGHLAAVTHQRDRLVRLINEFVD